MHLLTLVLLLALLLGGCSSWPWSRDNAEPPAELVRIEAPVQLRRVWEADLGKGVDKQFLRLRPAVDGGRVFAAEHRGRVAAYDLESGKRIWLTKTGMRISGGVGVGEGLVLVGTTEAEVIALDWADGKEVWRAGVTSEVLSVPAADAGLVVVQTVDGNVIALDAEDGERRWIYDRSVPVLSLRGTASPVIVEGVVITGLANGKLVALHPIQGLPLWEVAVAVPRGRSELDRIVDVDSTPKVRGGLVYAGSFQGRMAAVEGSSGRIVWARDMSVSGGFDLDFTRVYLTDESSHVWALDRLSGASIWRQDALARRNLTAPVVFDDYVAVGDFEGYLHLLARDDGALAGRVRVDGKGILASPVAAGNLLLVYGNTGTLAAYRIEHSVE